MCQPFVLPIVSDVQPDVQCVSIVANWRHLDYRMKSGKPFETLTFSGPSIAAVLRW